MNDVPSLHELERTSVLDWHITVKLFSEEPIADKLYNDADKLFPNEETIIAQTAVRSLYITLFKPEQTLLTAVTASYDDFAAAAETAGTELKILNGRAKCDLFDNYIVNIRKALLELHNIRSFDINNAEIQ